MQAKNIKCDHKPAGSFKGISSHVSSEKDTSLIASTWELYLAIPANVTCKLSKETLIAVIAMESKTSIDNMVI